MFLCVLMPDLALEIDPNLHELGCKAKVSKLLIGQPQVPRINALTAPIADLPRADSLRAALRRARIRAS